MNTRNLKPVRQGPHPLALDSALPVEFDASGRARQVLVGMGLVNRGAEAAGVDKVLNAAAWTYVAAFLTSLVYFLSYLLPLLSGDRRQEQ